MEFDLGFGHGNQHVSIPDENVLDVLYANEVDLPDDAGHIVSEALANPIGTKKLSELVKPGMKIAIITSDITRPMPTKIVLPQVMQELYKAGASKEDITLVFALGSHRKHTEDEKKKLAGEKIYSDIECCDSDINDTVYMGTTSRGTPVNITRKVAEADFRICLGNIEYHYFAGYSGGAKAIMPGVATRDAIQANHRFMISEDACAGKLVGNPVREDIEEAVQNHCNVDFIVNVVLNEHKEIVHAVAGDVVIAHRQGCNFLDKLYCKKIKDKADIVIVSQGGAPKDLNLYQLQKSLDNAKHAVKDGGIIVLVGSAKEGYGEKVFGQWIECAETSKSLIDRIKSDFQLGGHKAAAIAMVLEKAEILLVSEMAEDEVKKAFLRPMKSAQSAVEYALDKLGRDAKVIVMPFGGSTLPVIEQE